MTVTPDGKCAISGSDDKTLKIWDLNSSTLLRTLEGHTSGVWGSRNTGRAACYLGVMGQDAQSVGFE